MKKTSNSSEKSPNEPVSIYEEYLDLTNTYVEKYGPRTIVLLQVGAFFEVYGFRLSKISSDPLDTFDDVLSQITEFSHICNLNISEKKAAYDGRQVLMAGFRDYTLDKYLQILSSAGYTAVVYVQEKKGAKIIRVLDTIHSAGTYVSYEADADHQISNHVACIWLDLHKITVNSSAKQVHGRHTRDTMVCGIAIANIFTGKSYLAEFTQSFTLEPTTFDEIERMMAIYCPSEIIFLSNLPAEQMEKVQSYMGVKRNGATLHQVDPSKSEKAKRSSQQNYVRHMLSTFYGEIAVDQCVEFSSYPTAVQAFCYLLDFVQEHNPNLVKRIGIPSFYSDSHVLLANHTLKQLNILEDGTAQSSQGSGLSRTSGRLTSVGSFLNRCVTAMGRRLFHEQLVHPTTDETWLNREYAMTAHFLETDRLPLVKSVRSLLGQIRDMERCCRQLVLRKLSPCGLFYLYDAVKKAREMDQLIQPGNDPDHVVQEYLDSTLVQDHCQQILCFLDQQVDIEKCRAVSSMSNLDVDNILVLPETDPALSRALDAYQSSRTILGQIHAFLNHVISKHEKGPITGSDATEYVKIHETEKSGMHLQITKKRGQVLKKLLVELGTAQIPGTPLSVMWNTIKFTSASTSADEIDFPLLHQTCFDLLRQKEELIKQIATSYERLIETFESDYYPMLEEIAQFLGKIDVLLCKTHIAHEFHYCRPTILDPHDQEQSCVNAQGLRHVLIEHIQTNEIYVPNDIALGHSQTVQTNGILLYGTNAVGKTSLIRALGIAVIMAQAGLYVPCFAFTYRPYTAVFSRILGNDNLFKGLSTFAMEMSELRVILKMADQKSLILGDELCSGTETESALSIFVAGLMKLHDIKTSFIFATHFHEIVNYEEVQGLSRLALKHMAVHYDRELDALVYDRKVQDGPGNRMYGLEVCKSLHLDEEFLEQAYQIRTKYFPISASELGKTVSRYNAKKVRGLCEVCKVELGEEVHHIEPQCLANSDGIITTIDGHGIFHKNHPANLLSVCEACHLTAHKKIEEGIKISKKKTTKGYKII